MVVSLTYPKAASLLVLGSSLSLAQGIPDPIIERYVSLGVGGALAATIFYFYRQLADQSIKKAEENANAYRQQAEILIEVLNDHTKMTAELVASARASTAAIDVLIREQRAQYEDTLKDRRQSNRRHSAEG